MHLKICSIAALAALAVGCANPNAKPDWIAVDRDVDYTEGYAHSHGHVLKSNFNECVHSSRKGAQDGLCAGIDKEAEEAAAKAAAEEAARKAAEEAAAAAAAAAASDDPEYQTIVLKGKALFATNSAELTDAGKVTLNELAFKLNKLTTIKYLNIVGHTDSRGSEEYNQGLSERRSKSVKDHFMFSGLGYLRMNTHGMGETAPAADNATAEGRRQNRRVEVQIKAEELVE